MRFKIFFSNIDVRIQQAELEYRLGREELELLTLREESRALHAALELAETQEKQKNDTIFRYFISVFFIPSSNFFVFIIFISKIMIFSVVSPV